MQKKLIALAVAGMVSGAAFAQSNVTIYGVADAYWASVKKTNEDRYYAVNSGGLSGSRIGFKAVEDLGNGTSALAVIEYGFKMDDGNAYVGTDTGLAARQKLVGLTGGWGTAVAGYAQTAGYDYACGTTAMAGTALDPVGAVTKNILLTCGNNGRSGNALAYISPSFGGVSFAYNHARVTEGAGAAAHKDDVSANLLAASYAGGPVAVNAVYSKITDNDDIALAAAYHSIKEFGLRGSYDLGVVKLFASYSTEDKQTVADKDKTMGFGVAAPVGAGTIVASYGSSKLKETYGSSNNKMNSLAAAYLHSLSKRTTVYGGFNRLDNKTSGTSVKTDTIAVGLRHTF